MSMRPLLPLLLLSLSSPVSAGPGPGNGGDLTWLGKPKTTIVLSVPFDAPGCYATGSALGTKGETVTVVRAGAATYYDAAGAVQSCATSQLRVAPSGALAEITKWQELVNSAAPATQTTGSLGTGAWTLRAEGTGSVAVTAGTATATGLPATATAGTPAAFTVTGAGTVVATVTGSPTRFQLEGAPASSFIASAGARTNRALDSTVSVTTPTLPAYQWCLDVTATRWPGVAWSGYTYGLWLWGAGSGANRSLIQVSTNDLQWYLIDNASGSRLITQNVTGWAAGSTHRITACVNPSGRPDLYIDGVGAGTRSTWTGTGIMTSVPTTLHLGEIQSANYDFNGFLQNVRLATSTRNLSLSAPREFISTIGDSITASGSPAWPVTLASLLGSVHVVRNDAVGGYTTAQMLTAWTNTVRALHESEIVILGGINDVRTDVALATTESNLQTMYDQALADGARVVALTLTPFRGDTNYTAGRDANRLALNDWIRTYAAAHGITVVDTAPDFDDGTGALKAAYDSGDHLHPSAAGSARFAELVRNVLP